mmetsp:Transcript_10149/g.21183  ORF Transcript_10149/g.21183 Transcript_10149/m.21183 type:complete len:98 (-) Transcript_10149:1417-1710(-)
MDVTFGSSEPPSRQLSVMFDEPHNPDGFAPTPWFGKDSLLKPVSKPFVVSAFDDGTLVPPPNKLSIIRESSFLNPGGIEPEKADAVFAVNDKQFVFG